LSVVRYISKSVPCCRF